MRNIECATFNGKLKIETAFVASRNIFFSNYITLILCTLHARVMMLYLSDSDVTFRFYFGFSRQIHTYYILLHETYYSYEIITMWIEEFLFCF